MVSKTSSTSSQDHTSESDRDRSRSSDGSSSSSSTRRRKQSGGRGSSAITRDHSRNNVDYSNDSDKYVHLDILKKPIRHFDHPVVDWIRVYMSVPAYPIVVTLTFYVMMFAIVFDSETPYLIAFVTCWLMSFLTFAVIDVTAWRVVFGQFSLVVLAGLSLVSLGCLIPLLVVNSVPWLMSLAVMFTIFVPYLLPIEAYLMDHDAYGFLCIMPSVANLCSIIVLKFYLSGFFIFESVSPESLTFTIGRGRVIIDLLGFLITAMTSSIPALLKGCHQLWLARSGWPVRVFGGSAVVLEYRVFAVDRFLESSRHRAVLVVVPVASFVAAIVILVVRFY